MCNAAIVSAMGVAPHFLTRTVEAAATSIQGFKDDRVLVVIQLGGGNDGLNTVVPYSSDDYYRVRPKLGLKQDRLIALNDDLALNDRLEPLARIFDEGNLAIVQGVGYPNPDRSHFRSMEIWHTASESDRFESSGWIGRYFDHFCTGSARPHAGIAVGKERPQAFQGAKGLGVAFENPMDFGWHPGTSGDTLANFKKLNGEVSARNQELDFLRHVTSNALMSSQEVREAIDRSRGRIEGGHPLRRTLSVVEKLIKGGLDTRIFFVSATGFDTHANQLGQHDNLLRVVGNAIESFQTNLRNDGISDRVLTMVFSEFGRRVAENNSGGTDHGTAAPMFLVGDGVIGGLHGQAPDLGDLDQGDLKHTTDFRSVYATVLENWFEVNSRPVLNGDFAPLNLLS